MAGKSGNYTVLILVIAAFAVAGCSSPAGTIGQSVPKAATYAGLLVEYTQIYKVNTDFERDHVKLFEVGRDGKKQSAEIAQNLYEIRIFPGSSLPSTLPSTVSRYTFTTEGDMTILVSYDEHLILCPIKVTKNDDKASGIVVIWEDGT